MSKDNNTEKPSYDLNLNLISNTESAKDGGISINEIFQSFKKRRIAVLAVTMIAFVVGIISAFIYFAVSKPNSGIAMALLSYGYKGIEDGLDPLGRVLDVSKIKTSHVIEQALQELGLHDDGVTIEDVRSNMVIEGVLPDDVMQRLLTVKEIATKDLTVLESLSELQYFPTQYLITLERKNGLSKLSNKQLTDLTDSVLSHYTAYFIEEYSDRYIFETIAESFNQSQYDYFEVVQILNSQVNNMITYCEVKRRASPDFRSPITQMTFGDIITNLELVKSVDIGRISALVYASNMSRDVEKLKKLYEYNILRMTMDMNIALENAKTASEKAESYKKDTALVMGTLGETTTVTQPSEIYDAFMEDALLQSQKANGLQQEITFYQSQLEVLNSQEASPSSYDVKYVEDAIPVILTSLRNWADITNQTVDDYLVLDAFKDATKVIVPAHYQGVISGYYKEMAIIVAAVTFAGFFFAFLASIWKLAFPDNKPTE